MATELRRVRREHNLTQADAAKQIDTRQQNVANWETGTVPRPGSSGYDETIQSLAAFLSTSVPEILRLSYAPWADQEVAVATAQRRIEELEAKLAAIRDSLS